MTSHPGFPPGKMETPAAYIPMDRRQAIAQGRDLRERTRGAALFADISGFTPLTEMLARELGPRRGAEELTVYLNQVYDALITELHRFSGSVISFSGDAITCWFDDEKAEGRRQKAEDSSFIPSFGDSGPSSGQALQPSAFRATATALAMQQTMQQFAELAIVGGGTVTIAVKMAVATGPVRRLVVGDPQYMLVDTMAGTTLEGLAAAEHQAEKGEVVLDAATVAALGDAVHIVEWRSDDESGERFAVIRALDVEVPESPWPAFASDALQEKQVRPWLLPPVYRRLYAGQGEFLAELRPAAALFLRFGGIDYDEDDAAPAKLNAFIQQVEQILLRYDGSLLQLTIGDKGSYLYAAFGAPIAHEDDVDRAATAALEMQALPTQLNFLEPLQIGITYGRMRVGAYGSVARRTYGVLGDAVNLSARLMQVARLGQILVSDEAQVRASNSFQWERLPPIRVKGKREPVALQRLVSMRAAASIRLLEPRYALPMVGREAELALIADRLDRAQQGQGQIVAITAEAGMGKSRLVAEVVRLAQERPFAGYAGECHSYGTSTSYLVWQPIWRGLFGLEANEPTEQQIDKVAAELRQIDPTLLIRLPLLGPLLNLPIPDNDLTGSLSARLRKSSREALLLDVLQAKARQQPLLLVLDDCHWLDLMSRDLLAVVGRAIAHLPVLLLLVYRPLEDQDTFSVTRLPNFTEVMLTDFTPAEAERLIRLKLSQRFGETAKLPAALITRVTERAAGNPFYIDELVNLLQDRGIDLADTEALARLDLPGSLYSLILSRMDQLTEGQKAAVKVASVIGRVFRAAVLLGVYPQLGTADLVMQNLEVLSDLELTPLDMPEPEMSYIFKHVITQEVAYESLLYRTRAMLHEQIGRYIEQRYADSLEQQVHLLAHHFERSDNEEKKREYLVKAGNKAQAEYAIATAIDYYRRALPLLSGIEQVVVLRQMGEAYELIGEWPQAETRYRQAMQLAVGLNNVGEQAWCETALSELYRKQGNYEQASQWLERARAGFEAVGNQDGVAKILTCAGTVASQQGNHDAAYDLYQQSLSIRRKLNDRRNIANILNNLGIIARHQGNLIRARHYQKESLALRRELNDRWAIAMSLNNLGNLTLDLGEWAEARRRLEEALAIQREIGDKWAIGNTLNNLGNVVRAQGEYQAALALYEESLEIYGALRDKWALAYLLEDIGWLLAQQGQGERALRLTGAAAILREEIGAPLTANEAAKLAAALEPATQALSDEARQAAIRAGRAMSLSDALAYASDITANRAA
ncbi:MAG TPA: tetratricopeptide repeat protein [Anaerolineae bacterium]